MNDMPHIKTVLIISLMVGPSIAPLASAHAAQSGDQPGRTAKLGNGEVGRRQEAADIDSDFKPRARIDARVQNRIQNRINNRIDRNYDPAGTVETAPYVRAVKRTQPINKFPPI